MKSVFIFRIQGATLMTNGELTRVGYGRYVTYEITVNNETR